MIVECIENKGINLPEEILSRHGWDKSMKFEELTVGKTYSVYAIMHIQDIPCYLICSDIFDGQYITYPSLLPYSLFKTTQNKHSELWRTKEGSKDIGFKEVLHDEYFYGRLVEGYKREVQIFLALKAKVDQENNIE